MIEFKLESKRYTCTLQLNQKVTFIIGNSGCGKTELVRRLENRSSACSVQISGNLEYEVLSYSKFKDICRSAAKHICYEKHITTKDFTDLDSKEQQRLMREYWSISVNFPYEDSVIFVDDEDFVESDLFNVFFDCDHYNYYVIINRRQLSKIGYSVDEVYTLETTGIDHYLKHAFPPNTLENSTVDYIVTEGVGSDFMFFRSWVGDSVVNPTYADKIPSGGRTNVSKMLIANAETFWHKSILFLVDYVAFGSNYSLLISVCTQLNITPIVCRDYRSFEYLLLCSNLAHDTLLKHFEATNLLKFKSLEVLYTFRLKQITANSILHYQKNVVDFPVCYYKPCCSNVKYRAGTCVFRKQFQNTNKFVALFKGTQFAPLVEMLISSNKKSEYSHCVQHSQVFNSKQISHEIPPQ